jgi:redox-sensitive bicupin YhaK (pirin superfamily)
MAGSRAFTALVLQFGALRVINDDWIAPGMGFGTHPHRDMEIVTIPLFGALQHKDSTGGDGIIRKGEVQIMSAGTGIRHSEFNASQAEPCGLFQIWVMPDKLGISPRYEQKEFDRPQRQDRWQIIVSSDRREGSLWINQRAFLSLAEISKGSSLPYELKSPQNGVYFLLVSGNAIVGGERLESRDGLGITQTARIPIEATADGTEMLVIEVPV